MVNLVQLSQRLNRSSVIAEKAFSVLRHGSERDMSEADYKHNVAKVLQILGILGTAQIRIGQAGYYLYHSLGEKGYVKSTNLIQDQLERSRKILESFLNENRKRRDGKIFYKRIREIRYYIGGRVADNLTKLGKILRGIKTKKVSKSSSSAFQKTLAGLKKIKSRKNKRILDTTLKSWVGVYFLIQGPWYYIQHIPQDEPGRRKIVALWSKLQDIKHRCDVAMNRVNLAWKSGRNVEFTHAVKAAINELTRSNLEKRVNRFTDMLERRKIARRRRNQQTR